MYERGGHGSHTTDGDDETAVFLDASDVALGAFEGSVNDADEVALVVFRTVFTEISESVPAGGTDKKKHLHLTVRDDGWGGGAGLAVDPQVGEILLFEAAQVILVCVEEHQRADNIGYIVLYPVVQQLLLDDGGTVVVYFCGIPTHWGSIGVVVHCLYCQFS